MHPPAASRSPRARARLLAGAALVALIALALAAGTARAQVQLPPGAPTDRPGAVVAPGYDGRDSDDGRPDGEDDQSVLPPQLPAVDLIPRDDGGHEEPFEQELPPVTASFVAGRTARLRTDGKAAIPRGAPKRVRALISQYNRIVGKRYKWGGGHARLVDTGYDCSGAVGYGLIKGGMLRTTMVSGSFARWGAAGAGRWVTVYAHRSHVYIEVAGLRLDTSSVGDRAGRGGVRWRPVIGQRRGFKVRHPAGL
ncbi:MAG: hypothetical protein ACLGI5_10065 [Thermoleophilia bacterium]